MKKPTSIFFITLVIAMFCSCSDTKGRYINLSTGKTVVLEKDAKTGVMVDARNKEPVYLYIDTKNHDTIYGKTGKVINGHVIIGTDKKYVYDGEEKLKIDNSGAVKYKDGDYKVEVEKDGDMKKKDGVRKVKTDGETGEKKVKKD